MPIFEYVCMDCEHKFEELVLNGSKLIKCGKCGAENVRKLFSVFASPAGGSESSPFPEGACGRCGSLERRCE